MGTKLLLITSLTLRIWQMYIIKIIRNKTKAFTYARVRYLIIGLLRGRDHCDETRRISRWPVETKEQPENKHASHAKRPRHQRWHVAYQNAHDDQNNVRKARVTPNLLRFVHTRNPNNYTHQKEKKEHGKPDIRLENAHHAKPMRNELRTRRNPNIICLSEDRAKLNQCILRIDILI